jgi:hypothetical protein
LKIQDSPVRARQVLVPVGEIPQALFPAGEALVLHCRRKGLISVVEMGDKVRHPRWVKSEAVSRLIEQGRLLVKEFETPSRVLRPVGSLTPRQLNDFNASVHKMTPLLEGEAAELLEYPDEFSATCAAYARKQGLKRKYVEKMAVRWLTGGKMRAALINNLDRCGGPGKQRGFSKKVGGPEQKDGPEFDAQAAAPYLLAQRLQLVEIAERVWRLHRNRMTAEDFWLRMRREAKNLGLPPPSFAQSEYFLKDIRARIRARNTTGLVHARYRGVTYATQRSEADSTELQAFTRTELDANVRLKNPVYYKSIDVRWGYIAAVFLTHEAPSNAIFAELLFRAMTGMEATCRKLGLPYTKADFPPLHPGQKLAVDNQELTSPKMNRALLDHLGWEVELEIVGKGADKGKIEGTFGQDKRKLAKRREFFPKHALGKALEAAKRATKLDKRKLEAELIKLAWDHNHQELPATKVPAAFLETGRPLNRLELYKWDLERHSEVIKPIPPEHELPALLLPTDFYPVHVKSGIYISPRYYSSPELAASGILRRHARGATPQVEVAFHRGTAKFVYWVRGPRDLVKCQLVSEMEAALGEMTVAEVDEHVNSLPGSRKRERQRKMMAAAHESTPQSREDRKKVKESSAKGNITKDLAHTEKVRKQQIAKDAREDAKDRFGDAVPAERTSKSKGATQQFDVAQTDKVAQLLAQRRQAQEQKP